MRRWLATVIALGFMCSATPALAGDSDPPMLAVSPQLGFTAPQPFGELGSFPIFGADVGYILPFDIADFQHPLQVGLEGSFTAPSAEGNGTHAMLGESGAGYEWHMRQRIFTLQLTTMWRFVPPESGVSPHILFGPRIYMMESVLEASGNSGQDFGENRETNTEVGLAFGAGAEYPIGPGSATGSVVFTRSGLDQRITGEANTGAFNLNVGYRFFFF